MPVLHAVDGAPVVHIKQIMFVYNSRSFSITDFTVGLLKK